VAETRYGIMQYFPEEQVVGQSIGWYGEYLQQQVDLLAGILRPGMTVVETGAGVGAHSLALSRLLGERGHLIAYESRPVIRRVLKQNLRANRIRNVTVLPGDAQEPAKAAAAAGIGDPPQGAQTVLDALQLEQLGMIKINDGSLAPEVLRGAKNLLWWLRPTLFIATESAQGTPGLTEQVKQFGYRCWRMDSPLFNPGNFNRRDADIFDGGSVSAFLAIPEETEVGSSLARCVELVE
jgi:hypothetical protein